MMGADSMTEPGPGWPARTGNVCTFEHSLAAASAQCGGSSSDRKPPAPMAISECAGNLHADPPCRPGGEIAEHGGELGLAGHRLVKAELQPLPGPQLADRAQRAAGQLLMHAPGLQLQEPHLDEDRRVLSGVHQAFG